MKIIAFLKAVCSVAVLSFTMSGASFAAGQGTAAEAEAMVTKAVAYIKANGPEKAYEEFTNGKSFKDRDLYVIVNDMSGKSFAHGANPKMVGRGSEKLKDPDGRPIVPIFQDAVKATGKGWTVDYKWVNPATQKIALKAVYFERVGDTMVGVGIYR